MNIGKIHHIGYLVKNINKSVEAFKILGYEIVADIYDMERKADLCVMKRDYTQVELVQPSSESDIYPLLKKYNNTIYHICYEVDDIDSAVEELKKSGFLLFRGRQKAPALSESSEVVFLMHSHMGIIELVQEAKTK